MCLKARTAATPTLFTVASVTSMNALRLLAKSRVGSCSYITIMTEAKLTDVIIVFWIISGCFGGLKLSTQLIRISRTKNLLRGRSLSVLIRRKVACAIRVANTS